MGGHPGDRGTILADLVVGLALTEPTLALPQHFVVRANNVTGATRFVGECDRGEDKAGQDT